VDICEYKTRDVHIATVMVIVIKDYYTLL